MGVGGQLHVLAALPPGRRPGTHCIGGWVGPRAGLDGCEKSRPYRDSICIFINSQIIISFGTSICMKAQLI
jgi:hypothetical protein